MPDSELRLGDSGCLAAGVNSLEFEAWCKPASPSPHSSPTLQAHVTSSDHFVKCMRRKTPQHALVEPSTTSCWPHNCMLSRQTQHCLASTKVPHTLLLFRRHECAPFDLLLKEEIANGTQQKQKTFSFVSFPPNIPKFNSVFLSV